MNEIIIKRAVVFSLILGALIGVVSSIPLFAGYGFLVLILFCSPIVILYMKKNEKHLGILNNEESAILGAVIGFCSTIGFFAAFSPLVCIFRLIFKTYYAYTIPDVLSTALWLFILLVVVLASIFAATNATSAMGLNWILSFAEKKPKEDDSIDIKIED